MANIAWVDDDWLINRAMIALLENRGHTVFPFASKEEAEEHIQQICACDVIILDIFFPSQNNETYVGLSFLEDLRNEYHYIGPVIICSHVRDLNTLRPTNMLNVSAFIRKPVRSNHLYEMVIKVLYSNRNIS